MRKVLLILGAILIILVAGFFAFNSYIYNEKQAPVDQATEETPAVALGEPTFEWKHESFTEEEIPRTTISLEARYENGTVIETEIDTIQGGCNEYVEPDDDVYEGSEMIICYYAGLGHYFKVVDSSQAYLVQRKVFEEATPDYSPEPEPFETIAQFDK